MEINKKQKTDIDTDRLSDLPHHVLLHTIEFMNVKQAVQTCVLSKRWRDLWKQLTKLKLHHDYGRDRSDIFCKFVYQILSGRDDSIPLRTLSFEHGVSVVPSKSTLLEVMRYATSHKVKQLIVNAKVNYISDFELPPFLFDCRTLTYLYLGFWKVRDSTRIMFPKSLNLPSLKNLHIRCLTFTTSDDGCVEPFSACNMLNTLVIIGCYLQDDAQAFCISNSNVSSLTVGIRSNNAYKEAHTYKVVLCTPKLTSLTTCGRPTYEAPSACNLPFLEEVNIDYTYYYGPDNIGTICYIMISWLQLLANVKIVTLCYKTLYTILWAIKKTDSLGTQPPRFVRLKLLKVELSAKEIISDESVRKKAQNLLQNSPPARVDIIRNA